MFSLIPRIGQSVLWVAFLLAFPQESYSADPWKTIRIETDEYRFVPNRIVLQEGEPVRLEVYNLGNEEHEFRSKLFDGPLIQVRTKGVIVRSTQIHSITIEYASATTISWLSPEPGTYIFECRIPSHHGMDGVIIVEKQPVGSGE